MTGDLESIVSRESDGRSRQVSGWLRFGIVAAASALAAGLATAWWYKNTLSTLRQAEAGRRNPEYEVSEEDPADEI